MAGVAGLLVHFSLQLEQQPEGDRSSCLRRVTHDAPRAWCRLSLSVPRPVARL
jgi:hypothetical protein